MTLRGRTLLVLGVAVAGLCASVVWVVSVVGLHGLPPDDAGRVRACLVVSVLAVGVAIAAITVALLERLVLTRLERLEADVRRVGATRDLSLRVAVTGRDELSETAATINAALDALEEAHRRREESEAALRESEVRLEHSRRLESVGRLAGGVAHDFNNLLTIVLGHGELMCATLAPDDPSRPHVEEIRAAAERAALLTQQLLAFSRRQPVQPRLVDVTDHVTQLEPMLRRLVGGDVTVRVRADGPLAPVLIDPAQLTRLLMNLAAHARDAMPRGGTFSVDAAPCALVYADGDVAPGRYVLVTVRDDGVGMDAATAARVFEPFSTAPELGRGNGLGLASAHGIVHQAGGGIVAESEEGHGTTFRVYLPEATVESTVQVPRARRWDDDSELVLVVDDEPAILDVARQALEADGYDVLVAPSAERALAVTADPALPLRCIVTDALLPGMHGAELARQVCATRQGVAVLLVSGSADDVGTAEAVATGIGFLAKPFTPFALADEVRRVINDVAATVESGS